MSGPGKELLASVSSLLGPARAELGEMIADRVRLWRWERALKIIDRANEIRRSQPENAPQISLKFFLPFIEEASKEDDDNLSEWWSRLLASSSQETSGFDQACTDLLRNMGGQEAEHLVRVARFADGNEVVVELEGMMLSYDDFDCDELVRKCYDEERVYLTEIRRKGSLEWEKAYEDSELQALLSLEKLGLIIEDSFPLSYLHDYLDRYDASYLSLSRLGKVFLKRMTG